MNKPALPLLVFTALVAAFLLYLASTWQESPMPTAQALPPVVAQASPVDVRVVFEYPTATMEPTATAVPLMPTATLTYLESLPRCVDAKGGDVCLMVEPPIIPTPTAMWVCDSSFIVTNPADAVPCVKATDTPIGEVWK